MARVTLLLQQIGPASHAETLRGFFKLGNIDRFVGGVAYVRVEGVNAVAAELKAVAAKTTFFVGIRNEVTSVQGLRRLIELGVTVYSVDTATRASIFHPKIFIADGNAESFAVIGSANLTFNGLHNNIEAGAAMKLSRSNAEDAEFLDSWLTIMKELPSKFPRHVCLVQNDSNIQDLFDEGRLVDEEVEITRVRRLKAGKTTRDQLAPIGLKYTPRPPRKRKIIEVVDLPTSDAEGDKPKEKDTPASGQVRLPKFELVWESRGLKERDLNVPRGKNTSPTGSMLWKKGAAEDIDHRHFFRDVVFAGLDWQRDPKTTHLERSEGSFQLIIKGIDYGIFVLGLTHNTSTTSKGYKQRNSMTQIHWGAASKLVRNRDLLGRILSLYRRKGRRDTFIIRIE